MNKYINFKAFRFFTMASKEKSESKIDLACTCKLRENLCVSNPGAN